MSNEISFPQNPPLVLSERQKRLCKHLDTLNKIENFCPNANPSELFKSALYLTTQADHVALPDWMPEAAHSLRELLYPLKGKKASHGKMRAWISAIKKFFGQKEKETSKRESIKAIIQLYQEEKRAQQLADVIFDLYELFTKIAHHLPDLKEAPKVRTRLKRLGFLEPQIPSRLDENVFAKLIDLLETAWDESIPLQLDIHKTIDSILAQPPSMLVKSKLIVLLAFNLDAKMYFFAKANAQWADWLWDNGFLDDIKGKKKPADSYHRSPELNYIVRIAETSPDIATNIILAVPISAESMSVEVIERFLWICRYLPPEQLARVVPKIHKEKWIQLLGAGNHWFEHEKIVKSLYDSGDYDNLLLFAESLLGVRRAPNEPESLIRRTDTPFYFEDLSETKLFTYLHKLEGEAEKSAFKLVTSTFADIIRLTNTATTDEIPFIHNERFPFYDVDFYTLKLGAYTGPSYREEVVQLAALLKSQITSLFEKASSPENKRNIYEQISETLPESVVSWRLRFFVLSLAPVDLISQTQAAIFTIFDSTAHRDWLTRGAEYKKLLQNGFKALPDNIQRLYVEKIFAAFNEEDDKRYGSVLLSMIWEQLTPTEIEQLKTAGFYKLSDYKPHPSVGGGSGGWVRPTSPTSEEELSKLPIPRIVELLKTAWTPTKLQELNKEADFLTPINPEGLSETIKADFLKRPTEYINNATLFFDRERLSPHYTYAFFRMLPEAFKDEKLNPTEIDWAPLISVFLAIKRAAESAPLEPQDGNNTFHAWVAGWESVYSSQAELLKSLFHRDVEFTAAHEDIIRIIKHLLNHPDPAPTEETAREGSGDSLVNDPYSIAINSVRGKAFEALVAFAGEDWKKSEQSGSPRISSTIKELYESLLKVEQTRAIRFLYGIYLPFFYSRDKAWILSLFPEIFTSDAERKHLYLASWEGYLSATLYSPLFLTSEFQQLYTRGLSITVAEDPGRKYFTELDKGLGRHIGLAFGHFDEFTIEHPLFKEFWEKGTPKHHKAFISAIGKSLFSRHDSKENSVLKEKPATLEKIKTFWDWLIINCHSKEVFMKLGTWINHEHPFFDLAWLAPRLKATLEKTNGTLEWTHGLTNILPALAAAAPTATAAIARLFFLEAGAKNNDPRNFFHWDDECYETLQVLFGIPETKAATQALINDMLREGNGRFWKLKEILTKPAP